MRVYFIVFKYVGLHNMVLQLRRRYTTSGAIGQIDK